MHEPGWCTRGGAVVLDIAPLEALLSRTFSIGLDVGRGREKVALARLRLSRALPGAAATQAMAAEALAIEQGVATEQIAAAGGWRCPPPRSTGCRTRCCTRPPARWAWSPAWPRPNPARAPPAPACSRTPPCRPPPACSSSCPSGHACTTATSPAEQQDAAELGKAAEAACGLIELARLTAASGRTGRTDLS